MKIIPVITESLINTSDSFKSIDSHKLFRSLETQNLLLGITGDHTFSNGRGKLLTAYVKSITNPLVFPSPDYNCSRQNLPPKP